MSQALPLNPGTGERTISLALASVLALMPLLPTGPEYLNLPAGAWVEAVLVMLLVVALTSLALERSGERGRGLLTTGAGLAPLIWGWLAFLVAVLGATLVGVMSENEVSTPVFQAYLWELPGQLIVPMNQATHPLYPVRVGLTFFEGFLAFVLVVWVCGRASDVRRRATTALSGWSIGFALTAGFAVIQYVTRYRLHPYWVEVNPNLVRSHSTLDDPNALGSYLCLGLGITVGLFLAWRGYGAKPWAKWATAGAVVLGVLALGSTVSRSAWAATVLAVVLILASPMPLPRFGSKAVAWLRIGARVALVLLLLVATLSLAARAWVSPQPGYKPTSMVDAVVATLDPRNPLQDVLEARQIWWTAGSRMFLEHPFVGVGLGRFPRLLPEYQDTRNINENAHNFYLQVAAVMGSIGLAAFLFFLAVLAATLRPARASPGEEGGGLALGLAFGVLAFLLTCLTGHPLLLSSIQLLLATGLAASLVAVRPSMGDTRHLWRGGALLITLVAVVGYGVAASEVPGPSATGTPWGYAWGLHEPETDEGGELYRWTRQTALLYLVPPPGATEVELAYAVAQVTRNGISTEVSIQLEGQSHHRRATDDTWIHLVLPLPEEPPNGIPRGVTLKVRVDPPLVPATSGRSTDTRQLGIMLRAPRFVTAMPD